MAPVEQVSGTPVPKSPQTPDKITLLPSALTWLRIKTGRNEGSENNVSQSSAPLGFNKAIEKFLKVEEAGFRSKRSKSKVPDGVILMFIEFA
jgi:hypothetical protein